MVHGRSNITANLALHPPGVAKSSTSFGWGKDGNVTSAGWQVTLFDPMWHVSSRSGVATLRTAIHLLLTYLLTYLRSHHSHNIIVNGAYSKLNYRCIATAHRHRFSLAADSSAGALSSRSIAIQADHLERESEREREESW